MDRFTVKETKERVNLFNKILDKIKEDTFDEYRREKQIFPTVFIGVVRAGDDGKYISSTGLTQIPQDILRSLRAKDLFIEGVVNKMKKHLKDNTNIDLICAGTVTEAYLRKIDADDYDESKDYTEYPITSENIIITAQSFEFNAVYTFSVEEEESIDFEGKLKKTGKIEIKEDKEQSLVSFRDETVAKNEKSFGGLFHDIFDRIVEEVEE